MFQYSCCVQVHSPIHDFFHVTVWSDREEKAMSALTKLMEIGDDSVPLGQGHLMGFTYIQAVRAKRFLESGKVLGDGASADLLPFKQLNKLAAGLQDLVGSPIFTPAGL